MSDDLQGMACAEWIAAISADADGEDPGVDRRLLAAHVDSCGGCRSYRDQVGGLRRASVVGPATAMPDLSRKVAKRNAVADRASRWWLVRGLLAFVAVVIIAISLPDLLGGHGEAVHESRHVGAFSIAYAAALLLVALRPARARAILPVTMVLAGALFITAVIDVIEGHVPLVDEVAHLPEVASMVLVWMLARPLPEPRDATAARRQGRGPALELLRDPGDEASRDVG